jgi:hypothetical protein
MEKQEEYLRLARRAGRVDLARVKLESPASARVKLSLGETFALLAAHERRHLWQARQVKDHPSFPIG